MLVVRRHLLAVAAAGAVLASPAGRLAALAQSDPATAELMAEGALKDLWIGKPDAPVTIIEYASMTCSHCATFHVATWPALKSKYIDTGKVRFALREFPLDPLALAAFMLARCAGDGRREAVVELLFARQREWLVEKPVAALMGVVKEAGFTQESFESCLKNQQLYDAVSQTRDRASQKFGINSTPTFFINGKRQTGAITVDELDKLLAPFLKS
jgi:protein-disulfide isomerase